MNKFFFTRLALSNLKKNSKMYIPYFIASVGIIMMFYNMGYLRWAKDIGTLSTSSSLKVVLGFGTIIVGFFSIIFLIYVNSFLIKRRKKEFGLYNVLGLEKKHITLVLAIETIIIMVASLVVGLALGVGFSKFFILLLIKIVQYDIPFGFEVNIPTIIVSCQLFGGIFLWNLIYNSYQVYKSKPIELLIGGKVGEKEPKTKWFMGIFGGLCLLAGYYLSVTTNSPFEALLIFFIAVILVIIGTYSLFTCISIIILKLLKKNTTFYYKSKHFTTISGMMYRMKQNAAGLSNICILSTMVIVTVSTTVCLYAGIENILNSRYPTDIAIISFQPTQDERVIIDEVVNTQLNFFDVQAINESKLTSASYYGNKNGNSIKAVTNNSNVSEMNCYLGLLTLEEYNVLQGTTLSLNDDEVFIFGYRGLPIEGTIEIDNQQYKIKDQVSGDFTTSGEIAAMIYDVYYVIFKDMSMIENLVSIDEITYSYNFDIDAPVQTKLNMIDNLYNSLTGVARVEGKEYARNEFYQMYGGLFFIGLLLGTVFLMATILIIYYKQIAESYEDKEKYEIMRKVGMSHKETKQSINSQVMTVFFIPIIVATVHIAFAFPLIKTLLMVFNLTDTKLFIMCIIGTLTVFFLFYGMVYKLSTNTYLKNITE